MNKAVFLDFCGTIVEDNGHNHEDDNGKKITPIVHNEPKIISLASLAIANATNKGFKNIIISNQSCIGRGCFNESMLIDFIQRTIEEIERQYNGRIDAYYYCPHTPEDNCECRKPKTGMLEKAVEEHSIDIRKSWVMGDETPDIEFGRRAGLKTVLVYTGRRGGDGRFEVSPDYEAVNCYDGISHIIKFENEMHAMYNNILREKSK